MHNSDYFRATTLSTPHNATALFNSARAVYVSRGRVKSHSSTFLLVGIRIPAILSVTTLHPYASSLQLSTLSLSPYFLLRLSLSPSLSPPSTHISLSRPLPLLCLYPFDTPRR